MYQKAELKTAQGEPVITVTILQFIAPAGAPHGCPDVLLWGERVFKYEAHQGDTPHYKECFAHAVTPIPGVDDNGFTVRQRAEIEEARKKVPLNFYFRTTEGDEIKIRSNLIGTNSSSPPEFVAIDLTKTGCSRGWRYFQRYGGSSGRGLRVPFLLDENDGDESMNALYGEMEYPLPRSRLPEGMQDLWAIAWADVDEAKVMRRG